MITEQEAACLLVASHNDPVLAAWAAVFHEYRQSPCQDGNPYEAWDAYQELFILGVISSATFDNTDVKLAFFSGKSPSTNAIQDTLDNFHLLSLKQGLEPMTKLGNPFGSKNKTALAPRDTDQLSSRKDVVPLGGQTKLTAPSQLATSSLAPRQEPPSHLSPALGSPTADRSIVGSPTQPRPDLNSDELAALTPVMYCSCGERLVLQNDGGQAIEDDMPQGNILILDAVFSADCPAPDCNLQWHCSVGQIIPHGAVR